MRSTLLTALLVGMLLSGQPTGAQAPVITVLSSNGIRAVLIELVPQYERLTGQKVTVTFSVSVELKRRIDEGVAFDLTILTPGLVDELIEKGTLARGSRRLLARSGMALAVKAGAPTPDVSTTEAVARALRSAATIAFAKEGAGGVFFAGLMPKLGLVEVLAPKLRPYTTGTDVSAAIARGDAELGLLPLSEWISVPGVDVVGPFPTELQGHAVMVAGIGTHAAHADGAARFVDFLASAAATPTVLAHGMERVP